MQVWRPYCFITGTGVIIGALNQNSASYRAAVCTTLIIERLIACQR